MAKAKKQATEETKEAAAPAKKPAVKAAAEKDASSEAAAKKPAAKGGAKKKAVLAKAASPVNPAEPLIDTNLAASVAARQLANRETQAAPSKPTTGESEEFKQLKQNLFKPTGTNVPSFLQTPVGGNKFTGPGGRNQQQGRNQTFGADVNRTGVPRRTGG